MHLELSTNMFVGPSGTVKLAKKEPVKKESVAKPAASTEKKPAATKVCYVPDCSVCNSPNVYLQKETATKTAVSKKKAAAPKKTPAKVAESKKAPAPKKVAAPKPKANTASKRKTPTSVRPCDSQRLFSFLICSLNRPPLL